MATVNNTYYMFTVTSANATVGDTYTNNGVTYTVRKTLSAGTRLYCTAVANSVTSGSTLTRLVGTGDLTITFSTVELRAHINGITYIAGEILNMTSGCSLDVTESNTINPGNITCNTLGSRSTLNICNTSTTTPIVLKLNTENADIGITYSTNKINTDGRWLHIATGTGSAGQTIDFTTVMGGLIDSPTALWIETGDTRHYHITNPPPPQMPCYAMPFFNCGPGNGLNTAPDFDVQNININTEFHGDLDHGPVFRFNRTTKIAIFGNGGAVGTSNGGAVIPNGARVFYPNIHITSTVYSPTPANRNTLTVTSGSIATMSICAFSSNWNINNFSLAGDITMTSVACQKFQSGSWAGVTRMTNIVSGPDISLALASSAYSFAMVNSPGNDYYDFIWAMYKTTSTYSPGIQVYNTLPPKQFSNIWGWGSSTVAGCYPVMVESLLNSKEAPCILGPIYNIGGFFYLRECDNVHITEITHSDNTRAVLNTLQGQIFGSLGSKNFTLAKARKFTNGVSGRGSLITADGASYQFCVKDIVYDMQSNASTAIATGGARGYVANINTSNPRVGLFTGSSSYGKSRISNLYANTPQPQTGSINGTHVEWVMNSSGLYSSTVIVDSPPFQPIWTNNTKTAGRLCITPLSKDLKSKRVTIVSGVEGVDFYYSGNGFYAPSAGVEVIYANEYPVRGITNFTGATAVITHSLMNSAGATMEVSFRNNDGTDISTWTSWFDPTVSANWQTALASLTGYNSTKGFFPRFRIKTTTAGATRIFNYGYVTCTPDSAWTPEEIGFVPLLVSGQVNGSTIKLYDNTVPASPITVKTQVITADAITIDFPYNFDALAKPFKVKVRKSGYGEVISTDSTYQKGKGVPISQVLYVTIDDAVASLITGISINGATNTMTVTENRTKDELYAYSQWWGAQIANMDYDIPLVTSDSINYTSSFNIVLTNANITGNANITTTGTLTINGTSTSVPIITASNGKTGYLNISGLSGHAVYLEDGTGVQKDYQAGVTGTYSYFLSNVLTGTWKYVIKKAGYTYQVGTFTPATGGQFNISASTPQKLNPDGTAMYQGTSSVLCTIVISGTTQANIEIGDGSVSAQNAFDMTETALMTNLGMIWLTVRGECSIFLSFGGNYLFMSSGWRLYRRSAGDGEATLLAYATGQDGIAVDDSNGGVKFLSSSSSGGATPEQIWNYANRTITGGGGGGGNGGLFSMQDRKNIVETLEKVKTIENTDLSEIIEKIDENHSENILAKEHIIDTIKETEIEVCSDIVRSKKELKEDNIATRNLVRQKTKKIDENTQKLVDGEEEIKKMIEDEASEIEDEIEKIIGQEADMIENDIESQIQKEADEIESEIKSNQSHNGND